MIKTYGLTLEFGREIFFQEVFPSPQKIKRIYDAFGIAKNTSKINQERN